MARILGRRRPRSTSKVWRVVWTDEAVAGLESIARYVHDFSPNAAVRLATSLKAVADSLTEHPDRGRTVGRGMRELTVIHPYLIRYRVDGDRVIILRIRHGARRRD